MASAEPVRAPNLADLEWLDHGFGLRNTLPPAGLRTVHQIHSAKVGDAADTEFVEGDALVSNQSGVRVAIKTADCVPILLAEPSIRAVAAIHAGWRGTVENIAASAVQELVGRWGAKPRNIRAAIGPSIGVCCYEVGPDVARRFGAWVSDLENTQGHEHLDLRAVNELQLRAAGVENIWISQDCTFCATDRYYSFRRERKQAGRMLSFVGLR
jgi:polyphenol oxidase